MAAELGSARQFTFRSGFNVVANVSDVVTVFVLADIGQPQVIREQAFGVVTQ